MRAVVQRVSRAQVTVAGEVVGRIDHGLCVLVGAGQGDTDDDAALLVDKLVNLRIFNDGPGDDARMNLSLLDVRGGLLAISQFTLFGDARKGRRPSFVDALPPAPAEALYERFLTLARATGVNVQAGRFRTTMAVELVNDGPVTILLDTRKQF